MSFDNQTKNSSEEEELNIGELIYTYFSNWKIYVVSLVLCLSLAFLYLRTTIPTYKVSATIMVRDEKKGGDFVSELSVFDNMDVFGKSSTDNEIEVLKSKSLIKNLIFNLDLYVDYRGEAFLKKKDLFGKSPILLEDSLFSVSELSVPYVINVNVENPKEIRLLLSQSGEEVLDTTVSHFPVDLQTKYGKLTFLLAENANLDEFKRFRISITPPMTLARSYLSRLTVTPTSKTSSVVNLSLNTTDVKRGILFLNGLIDLYNTSAIEEKNEVAVKTASFIEERITMLTEELGTTEKDLERYKKKEGLTELSSNAALYLQQGSEYEQKRVENETQLNLVLSLKNYLEDINNRGLVIPANVGLSDVGLVDQINQYNNLLLSRNRLMRSTSESNPVVAQQTSQIDGLYDNVRALVNNVEKGLRISQTDLKKQSDKFKGRISNVPTQERLFVEIERQRQIQQQLFLMLLQKREENALTMAAAVNKAKIVDESASEPAPVAPRKTLIYIVAFVLAFVIPMVYIFFKRLFSVHFSNAHDLQSERLSSLPVLAEVPFFQKDMDEKKLDRIRIEYFRLLRTNIRYLMKDVDSKVILFTSSVKGEGKTYLASHTAISFASLGKKVLLIGADIRNPKLQQIFNKKKESGLTAYLASNDENINKLIETTVYPNLNILFAGPIPPNPTELLSRERLDQLFIELRKQYDYIIVDSAPVGLVTDTLVLARLVDVTVYVCRANYTNKRYFVDINRLSIESRLPNMALVLNAVSNEDNVVYNRYGYGYGHHYGYGYGE